MPTAGSGNLDRVYENRTSHVRIYRTESERSVVLRGI
jgi:hypothetical protein